MLERAHLAGYLHEMDRVWESWMTWFTELSETHTSLAVLSFFRSPNPHRSWITASGAVLDAASLRMAVLNIQFTPAGGLCIRSGYLALREIAAFFGFDFDDDPRPDDPISISREEFDEVYERLGASGVPVRPDRDRAWRDFRGWRVNYDGVLIALGRLRHGPVRTVDVGSLVADAAGASFAGAASSAASARGGSTVNNHVRNRSTAVIVSSERIDWKISNVWCAPCNSA